MNAAFDPVEIKRAAIQPILDRIRRADHWVVRKGCSPGHRARPLTDALITDHLSDNGLGIGACPMERGSSTTRVAVLDLDDHDKKLSWGEMVGVARDVCSTGEILDLNFVPFRSRGGRGIHLVAIWDGPQDASRVRAVLAAVLSGLRYSNGTKGVQAKQIEIFPKQDAIPVDGWGNMFVLPGSGQSAPINLQTGEVIDWADVTWTASYPVPVMTAVKHPSIRDTFLPVETEDLTDQQVADVTSALMFRRSDGTLALDPDDRDVWIKVIQNGKRHPQLRESIRQWSALSSKHTDEEFDRKWAERGGDRSDYRSIISAAQAKGWPNPRAHKPPVIDIRDSEDVSLPTVPSTQPLVSVPAPFRGPMAAAVSAAVSVAPKPQPELTTLSALVGMASCIPGHYRLPSGARMNLYGLGVLETGGGKDLPRNVARQIGFMGGAVEIGRPASGQGLEDALAEGAGMLCEVDEIAHTLQAANAPSAPSHLVEMARTYLALFSAGSSRYNCRVRANAKPGATATPRVIANPCLSLLGFSTPEKLGEALGVSSIEDGLLGRMLLVEGRSGVEQRLQQQAFIPPAEFARYKSVFRPGLATGEYAEIVVQWGDGVEARFEVLMREFNTVASTSPFAKALQARAFEKVERISGVLAVFDDPVTPLIRLDHVAWAEAFVKASNEALLRFAGERMHSGQVQANAAKVLAIVDRIVSGEIAVQTSAQVALVRKGFAPRTSVLKASKLSKREFDEAVEHLVACGDAEACDVKLDDSDRKVGAIRRASI